MATCLVATSAAQPRSTPGWRPPLRRHQFHTEEGSMTEPVCTRTLRPSQQSSHGGPAGTQRTPATELLTGSFSPASAPAQVTFTNSPPGSLPGTRVLEQRTWASLLVGGTGECPKTRAPIEMLSFQGAQPKEHAAAGGLLSTESTRPPDPNRAIGHAGTKCSVLSEGCNGRPGRSPRPLGKAA